MITLYGMRMTISYCFLLLTSPSLQSWMCSRYHLCAYNNKSNIQSTAAAHDSFLVQIKKEIHNAPTHQMSAPIICSNDIAMSLTILLYSQPSAFTVIFDARLCEYFSKCIINAGGNIRFQLQTR